MSKLEEAMDALVEVFCYYSSKEGDKFKLSRRELSNLLRGELRQYIQASRDHTAVERIMQDLDTNLDGSVNFEEFVQMVTRLTVTSIKYFDGYEPVLSCGTVCK